MAITVLNSTGATVSLKSTTDSGDEVTHNKIDSVAVPDAVLHGYATVGTPGTAVPLVGSTTAIKSGVTVKAYSANTDLVFVGKSTVSNTGANKGFELNAKESVFIEVDDLYKVYVYAASGTTGHGVCWIAS